jgi:hypothetical protein
LYTLDWLIQSKDLIFYTILFTLGQTAKADATGIPVIGLTPVTIDVKFAVGRPFVSKLTAVVIDIAPTQTGPATKSPIQAAGRPFTRLVGIPGPVTTSPVAVIFIKVALGVIGRSLY